MIKKVIHVSDIHIRNILRHEEYSIQLTKFIDYCKAIVSEYQKDEVRILISGDLVHQKNTISPDLMPFVSTFIRELEKICKVIIYAGNHDLIVGNLDKKDTITSLFETADFQNTFFLDSMLNYSSGYVIDENVIWCLYSIYDNYRKPNIEELKIRYPEKKIIGLYHGMINGSVLNNGNVIDNGLDGDIFYGCDCVMAGDIHKRQELKRGDVKIIYPGSLIQQTFGETVTQHGFVLWDIDTLNHQFYDIENEYSLYDFEISSIDDIDNDKEILKNY